MEQRTKEENIKNNLVLCIDRRKIFTIKLIQKSNFRNLLHMNKIRLLSISGLFINHDETDCVSERFRKIKWI